MKSKKEMLNLAVSALNAPSYPFSVSSDDECLIIMWRWKDALLFGSNGVSKEISDFRYVVILREDGSFYGYDTDEESLIRGSARGYVNVQGKSFIGQEMRIHKELAFGKNTGQSKVGIQTWNFSTKQIHDPVRRFFESNGWKYREQAVFWVPVSGSSKMIYLVIGILFTLIGSAGAVRFCLDGMGMISLFPVLFALLGIWAFMASVGIIKLPVFSKRFGLALVVGSIFLSFTVITGITELLLLKYVPELQQEKLHIRPIFHLVELAGGIGGIGTFIVYKITGR